MAALSDAEGRANQLAAALTGRTFGATRVLDAEARVDRDSEDEDAIFLHLKLSDPANETWPREDMLVLRRAVLESASKTGVELKIYVRTSPATDRPQADDENRLGV